MKNNNPTRFTVFDDDELDVEERTPERELLLQVLIRALRDVVATSNENHHAKDDAERWIKSDSARPYSFIWLIEHLYPNRDRDTVVAKIRYALKDYKPTGIIMKGRCKEYFTATCQFCGCKFETNKIKIKYCSYACHRDAKMIRQKQLKKDKKNRCKFCNIEIKADRDFCSQVCVQNYRTLKRNEI